MKIAALALVACSHAAPSLVVPDAPPPETQPDAPARDTSPLVVHALGVQGFALQRGHDVVMTAPLFTRQDAISVTLSLPITSDTAAIDAGLAGIRSPISAP